MLLKALQFWDVTPIWKTYIMHVVVCQSVCLCYKERGIYSVKMCQREKMSAGFCFNKSGNFYVFRQNVGLTFTSTPKKKIKIYHSLKGLDFLVRINSVTKFICLSSLFTLLNISKLCVTFYFYTLLLMNVLSQRIVEWEF